MRARYAQLLTAGALAFATTLLILNRRSQLRLLAEVEVTAETSPAQEPAAINSLVDRFCQEIDGQLDLATNNMQQTRHMLADAIAEATGSFMSLEQKSRDQMEMVQGLIHSMISTMKLVSITWRVKPVSWWRSSSTPSST